MERIYSQIIVNRILSLCKSRGWSINYLAKMSGVGQSTLDNLVNGRTNNPTLVTIHKIAVAFSMTPAEFLDFPDLNSFSFDDQSED